MSKPRPFLNTPYCAYVAREVPPPDDELVRVGPARRAASTCGVSGSPWRSRAI